MTKRIDHAKGATQLLDRVRPESTEGQVMALVHAAQVHATLALVEQQRIANLIALGQFRVGVNDLPHLRHLVIEPKDEHNIQPVTEIRDALGLS